MNERELETLLLRAEAARASGSWPLAIELLKRALTIDPDHARAHAVLALALLGARRLHGAAIECSLALALDGGDPVCNLAAAAVRTAERKLGAAWEHVQVGLAADPTNAEAYVLAANICSLRQQREQARSLLEQALELDPEHVATHVEVARFELGAGRLAEARRYAEAALAIEPESVDAHVIAGLIRLRAGELAEAEEHARFVLQIAPDDAQVMELWAALKARKSVLLGLWWRFNAFVTLRSERGMLGILLGSFVAVQIALIATDAAGMAQLETGLSLGWVALCVYTWFAPVVFRRMLARELATVHLRHDY